MAYRDVGARAGSSALDFRMACWTLPWLPPERFGNHGVSGCCRPCGAQCFEHPCWEQRFGPHDGLLDLVKPPPLAGQLFRQPPCFGMLATMLLLLLPQLLLLLLLGKPTC